MSYPFDLVIALGSTQTGLTLTASVRDAAGSALGSQPAYTIVEQGGGWYSYHTSAMPDGQRGVVRILSGAAVMAVGVVTPVETEGRADLRLINGVAFPTSDLLAQISIAGTVSDTTPAAGDFTGSSGLSSSDAFYEGSVLAFTSGALQGLGRRITTYTGSTKAFAFAVSFPTAPADGDAFAIFGRIDA